MKGVLRILIILFLWLSGYETVRAQYARGYEIDLAVHDTDLDTDYFFDLAVKYNHWFSRYTGISIGALVNGSKLDMGFDSPDDANVYYDLDNFVLNLTGTVGMKFATPTVKGFGLACDLNLLVAPIPLNIVSVNKRYYHEDEGYTSNSYQSQVVYTRFNPAYSAQVSLFYDKRKKSSRMRFAVGAGISNYNPYNAYYHADIDDIKLRDHVKLKPSDQSIMIFVRMSGFKLK